MVTIYRTSGVVMKIDFFRFIIVFIYLALFLNNTELSYSTKLFIHRSAMLPEPLRPEHQMRGDQRRAGVHVSARLLRVSVLRVPSRVRVRLRLQPVANVPAVQVHVRVQRGHVRFHSYMRRPQPPADMLVPEGIYVYSESVENAFYFPRSHPVENRRHIRQICRKYNVIVEHRNQCRNV